MHRAAWSMEIGFQSRFALRAYSGLETRSELSITWVWEGMTTTTKEKPKIFNCLEPVKHFSMKTLLLIENRRSFRALSFDQRILGPTKRMDKGDTQEMESQVNLAENIEGLAERRLFSNPIFPKTKSWNIWKIAYGPIANRFEGLMRSTELFILAHWNVDLFSIIWFLDWARARKRSGKRPTALPHWKAGRYPSDW